MAEVLVGMRGSIGATTRAFQAERIPAPSAVSIMAGLQDPIPSEGSPVLVASTAVVAAASMAAASMAAEVDTAAEGTDSFHEVTKP